MSIFAIGLNHTTAPVALREQFAFGTQELSGALSELKHKLASEVALLSTCNRTELYFASDSNSTSALAKDALAFATEQLARYKGVASGILSKHVYQLHSEQPIRHAYRVASGLDSMVLGEPQILGQLKQAVRTAQDSGTLGTQLQHLFQQSFAVAKQVRTQTQLGAASVSMAAAAVRLAQRIFGDLSTRKILMIGAGEMIELCAQHFSAQNPLALTIANRTIARGEALVAQLHKQGHTAQVIPLSQLPDILGQYDIVISCTASTLPIIGLGLVQRALAYKASKRQAQTTMMVDLAVPRDIETEVSGLNDVYLYTVDDLGRIVQEGRNARSAAVSHAEQIIDSKVHDFLRWQSSRRAVPIIQAVQHHAHGIRQSELDKALRQLAKGLSAEQVLEQLSRQLTQKLMHGTLSLSQTLAADSTISQDILNQMHSNLTH